ncbi:hypothetical protein [Nocardioides astragali]|jgi:hypothetical protein|uniref:Uncharacterized protein n=1 Tax=Nocardioides astragali TaxID=1776736 RepID=A0ABW2NBV7_9ACTN|nr:hypothetical protein [Nocardioides astragali]
MIWHTITVAESDLELRLFAIRRAGGSVTHSFPGADGYTVIYTTAPD